MPQSSGASSLGDDAPARVSVRGPQQAPSADEALMGLGHGHLRSAGSSAHQDDAARLLGASQLQLALGVAAVFFTVLTVAFLMVEVFVSEAPWRVAGVPLSWLVPVMVLGPLTIIAGWWYLRAARRREREFLVSTSPRFRRTRAESPAEGGGR